MAPSVPAHGGFHRKKGMDAPPRTRHRDPHHGRARQRMPRWRRAPARPHTLTAGEDCPPRADNCRLGDGQPRPQGARLPV